jgi:hypothetical protein
MQFGSFAAADVLHLSTVSSFNAVTTLKPTSALSWPLGTSTTVPRCPPLHDVLSVVGGSDSIAPSSPDVNAVTVT